MKLNCYSFYIKGFKPDALLNTLYTSFLIHPNSLIFLEKCAERIKLKQSYRLFASIHALLSKNRFHRYSLREAEERHHDNAGGSRKLSAVAAGHTMEVKERHYEKVGEDFEQVHDSYRKFHPAFVES